ncbi:MAG: DNA alkylation repair protein [Bacteroidetes bacterium]|nr:DNA alkylation repair protein [Bacteroidota bacterium]MBU1680148.1 DNA alkylation repair protein [Bacteroidota bacterium]MBU2506391.1 DNA alkylation repair protein [Bacteroidota bacterium]
MNVQKYISDLQTLFRANADPENAFNMKKYMKDNYEFYGIKTPERNELTKDLLRKENIPGVEDAKSIIIKLWKLPERELQYFAMRLAEKVVKKFDAPSIEFLEYLVVNKSWWDTVDFIAANLVGMHFKRFPHLIEPNTVRWINSNNMWLQRSALLFQLKYKKETNTELLFDYCTRLSKSNEFFIRKGIGWALREYSKYDPPSVRKFVKNTELSGLSNSEALRLIS